MKGKFVLAPNGDQLVPSCLCLLYRGGGFHIQGDSKCKFSTLCHL